MRGRGLVGCLEGRELGARTPGFPRFILMESFSDTLLIVRILDMIVIWGRFCSPEGVINTSCGNYGSLLALV